MTTKPLLVRCRYCFLLFVPTPGYTKYCSQACRRNAGVKVRQDHKKYTIPDVPYTTETR